MNEEIDSISILKQFAHSTNRKFEYSEKSYPDVHPVTFHRRELFVSNFSSF